MSKVSRFWLASVAEQAGLNLTWSKIPEDIFSRDVFQLFLGISDGGGKLRSSEIT